MGVEQRVADGEGDRPRRRGQRHRRVQLQRRIGQQVGLRAWDGEARQLRVGRDLPLVSGDVCGEQAGAGRAGPQRLDAGGAGRVGRVERTVHPRVQRRRIPCDVGRRRHRRSARLEGDVHAPVLEIDRAVAVEMQLARREDEVRFFSVARPSDRRVQGERADIGQVRQRRDQPVLGLVHHDPRVDLARADRAADGIAPARRVEPAGGQRDTAILQRLDVRLPLEREARRLVGDRWGEGDPVDLQRVDVDADRQAESAAAASLVLALGQAQQV